MVRKSAHSRQRRALLPSSLGGRADEDTDILAVISASLPLLAGLVPESLPLGREVAVTGRDAEEEGVVLGELVGSDERDGAGLAGCMHLGEDFVGKGLLDSTDGRARSALGVLCIEREGKKETERERDSRHPTQRIVPERSNRVNSLVNIRLAPGSFNARFFRFRKLGNVAVHGVLYRSRSVASQHAASEEAGW